MVIEKTSDDWWIVHDDEEIHQAATLPVVRVSVLNTVVLLLVVWTALRFRLPQRTAVQRLIPFLIPLVALVAALLTIPPCCGRRTSSGTIRAWP